MKNKRIQLTTLSPPGTADFNRVNRRCRKCFPITKEFRQQFNDAVVSAYQQALTQSQHKGMEQESSAIPEQEPGIRMG